MKFNAKREKYQAVTSHLVQLPGSTWFPAALLLATFGLMGVVVNMVLIVSSPLPHLWFWQSMFLLTSRWRTALHIPFLLLK